MASDDVAALLRAAAPTCGIDGCERRVVRIEQTWHSDEDGIWRPVFKAICGGGHRKIVEPLP